MARPESLAGEFLRRLVAFVLSVALSIPVTAFGMVVYSKPVVASAYTSGLDRYQQGDFAGAEKILRGSLRTKMAPRELASTYKLLGICQFMQNNRNGATQSFKIAIATDPTVQIAGNEVLDDAVIGFFNKIKSGSPKASAPVAAAPKKPAPSPAGVKMAAKRATDAKGNPLKQTFLIINSSNKGANVFIDGIIAGQVNSRINTSPGKVMVEVSQPGFKPKKVRINITKDVDNAVSINLDKIQPKAPPRPKAPPAAPVDDDLGIAVAAGAKGAKSKAAARTAMGAKAKSRNPNDDLFGETRVAQPPPTQSGPRIAAAPSQGSGMPQAQMQQQMQPPMQPQGMAPQGYPPPGYQMPGYGGGMQQYPQQAPYPTMPGYYPPPNYYPQAPQVIIQQAPPAYYGGPDMGPSPMSSQEPLPPPPSIDDPVGGGPGGGGPSGGGGGFDGGGPPPEPSLSPESLGDPGFGSGAGGGSRGGRGSSGSGSKQGTNTALYLLPLGVGQFVNHKPLLGALFAGAQVGSAVFGFLRYQTAEQRTKEINNWQLENCTDESGEEALAACEEYVKAGQANVATINQQKLFGFIGAGAAYGLSVVQAFLDTPTKTAKKQKRRGFSQNELPGTETAAEDTYDDEIAANSGFKWRFDVAPYYNTVQSTVEPALTLNLDWRF